MLFPKPTPGTYPKAPPYIYNPVLGTWTRIDPDPDVPITVTASSGSSYIIDSSSMPTSIQGATRIDARSFGDYNNPLKIISHSISFNSYTSLWATSTGGVPSEIVVRPYPLY